MRRYFEITIVTARGKMTFPVNTDNDQYDLKADIQGMMNKHNQLCAHQGYMTLSNLHIGQAIIGVVGPVDWAVVQTSGPTENPSITVVTVTGE